ncbi:hypothetical protein RND71_006770 [Anisodus tanguticus]|uniref:Uncharacterized protein n=1 Tax=Anisodus tanguticus TaxID=243964 RepID=A0AAE1SRF0_9SOLA|nr:hypothetical protein RND71_006770 [Anisodus tanguticus]
MLYAGLNEDEVTPYLSDNEVARCLLRFKATCVWLLLPFFCFAFSLEILKVFRNKKAYTSPLSHTYFIN